MKHETSNNTMQRTALRAAALGCWAAKGLYDMLEIAREIPLTGCSVEWRSGVNDHAYSV